MTDSPRLIGRKDAALYLDIAESTFSMWVATHIMPPPTPGTRKWDKRAIDARLDEISGLAPAEPEDAFQKWEQARSVRKASGDSLAERRKLLP